MVVINKIDNNKCRCGKTLGLSYIACGNVNAVVITCSFVALYILMYQYIFSSSRLGSKISLQILQSLELKFGN